MNPHLARPLSRSLALAALSLSASALVAETIPDDLFVEGSLDVSGTTAVEDLSAAHVVSASSQGDSAFYGRQLGGTFTNTQPIFQAVSDYADGAGNWFFRGTIGGPAGTETFSIRADGQIKSANLAGTGTALLVASPEGVVQRGATAITTSGSNVGIGTTSPADTLTANGNIRALAVNNGGFVAYDSPSGGNHLFSLVRGDGGNSLDISSYDGIGFATGATGGPSTNYSLFIANNGNIGIGAIAPDAKLTVVPTSGQDGIRIETAGPLQPTLLFKDTVNNSGGGLRLAGGGSELLQLGGGQAGTVGLGAIQIGTDVFGASALHPYIDVDANRVTILNGNVGIGTGSPYYGLDIYNGHAVFGNLPSQTDQGGDPKNLGIAWASQNQANVISNLLTVDRSGNYGGDFKFYSRDPGGGPMPGALMTITSAGNVGVGTMAPSEKLDVVGNAKVSGTLTVGGTPVLTATGNGSGLTGLNATQLTTGTVPNAVLPSSVVQVDSAQILNNKTLQNTVVSGDIAVSGGNINVSNGGLVYQGPALDVSSDPLVIRNWYQNSITFRPENYNFPADYMISFTDSNAWQNNLSFGRWGVALDVPTATFNVRSSVDQAAPVFRVVTNAWEPLVQIAANGNVGVGTIASDARLTSVQMSNVVPEYNGTGEALRLTLDTSMEGEGPALSFQTRQGVLTNIATIKAAKKENGGDLQFWLKDNATGPFIERVIFKENGNVGIGTNSPITKLDVAGSVRAEFVTLGRPVESNNWGFNTTGLSQTTVAEVRAGVNAPPPALAWHYENRASRFIRMEQDGTINVVAPAGENGGQAVLAVNGSPVLTAAGSGSGLIGLNASQLTAGTVPVTVLPSSVVQTTTIQTLTNKTLAGATLAGNTTMGGSNSAQQVIVTDAGNVGIGIDSPVSPLVIKSSALVGSSPLINAIEVTASGPVRANQGSGLGILFNHNNNGSSAEASRQAAIYSLSEDEFSNSVGLGLYTQGSGGLLAERLRVTAIGKVGIGTSAPENTLSVNGTGSFMGNVGIGTTSPQATLQLVGSQAFDSTTGLNLTNGAAAFGRTTIRLTGRMQDGNEGWSVPGIARNSVVFARNLTSGSGTNVGALGEDRFSLQYNMAEDKLGVMGADGTPKLVVQQDGNVGIGTVSPDQKLTLEGNRNQMIKQTQRGIMPDGSTYDVGGITYADTHLRDTIPSDPAAYMKIRSVNTNPNFPTAIRGTQLEFGTANGADGQGTTAATRLTITAEGNLGIGTSAPTERLQVAGNIQVSGKVRVPESGDLSMGDFRTGTNPATP